MRKAIIISTTAVLLASCGGPEGSYEDGEGNRVEFDADNGDGTSEYRFTNDEGEELVVNSGSNAPVNLPDGYSVYPGAEVVSNTTLTQADGQGAIIVMTSDADPEDIVAFYRRQAEAADIEIRMEMNSNGTMLVGGEGADGETFSISASPSGDDTTVQLVVGKTND